MQMCGTVPHIFPAVMEGSASLSCVNMTAYINCHRFNIRINIKQWWSKEVQLLKIIVRVQARLLNDKQ